MWRRLYGHRSARGIGRLILQRGDAPPHKRWTLMEDQTPIRYPEANSPEALNAHDQSLTQLTCGRLAESRDHIEASRSPVRGPDLMSDSTQGVTPIAAQPWQLLSPPL